MDLGIRGKTALVCAASKGLGKGCAISLARESLALREPALVVWGRSGMASALLALPEYRELLAGMNMPRADAGADA